MRRIISLFCLLLPVPAGAEQITLADTPNNYTVVKHDTLWNISAKFYVHPWQWPMLWELNKENIPNPHWIYPGDTIRLEHNTKTIQPDATAGDTSLQNEGTEHPQNPVYKLSPQIHILNGRHDAIPVIPLKAIAPFLARPLIANDREFDSAPKIIGGHEHRTMMGTNDLAFVGMLPDNLGTRWQIFRTGQTFIDPDSKEVLGREIIYIGDAEIEKFGEISQLRIAHSQSEILTGDFLAQRNTDHQISYQPHAPSTAVNARIISIQGGLSHAGKNTVIILNKGRREGLETGHVLALYQQSDKPGHLNPLPSVRSGLAMIFRVFDKVSYALILQSELPLSLHDTASTP